MKRTINYCIEDTQQGRDGPPSKVARAEHWLVTLTSIHHDVQEFLWGRRWDDIEKIDKGSDSVKMWQEWIQHAVDGRHLWLLYLLIHRKDQWTGIQIDLRPLVASSTFCTVVSALVKRGWSGSRYSDQSTFQSAIRYAHLDTIKTIQTTPNFVFLKHDAHSIAREWFDNNVRRLVESRDTTDLDPFQCQYRIQNTTNLHTALTAGRLDVVKWFRDQSIDWVEYHTEDLCAALRSGNAELTRWVASKKFNLYCFTHHTNDRRDVWLSAFQGGNLDLIKWVMDELKIKSSSSPGLGDQLWKESVRNVAVYQWANNTFIQNPPQDLARHVGYCAETGSLETLTWIFDQHPSLARLLVSSPSKLTKYILAAARVGNLDMMKFLYDRSPLTTPLTTNVDGARVLLTVRGVHVDKWFLQDVGCKLPWPRSKTILQWTFDRGLKITDFEFRGDGFPKDFLLWVVDLHPADQPVPLKKIYDLDVKMLQQIYDRGRRGCRQLLNKMLKRERWDHVGFLFKHHPEFIDDQTLESMIGIVARDNIDDGTDFHLTEDFHQCVPQVFLQRQEWKNAIRKNYETCIPDECIHQPTTCIDGYVVLSSHYHLPLPSNIIVNMMAFNYRLDLVPESSWSPLGPAALNQATWYSRRESEIDPRLLPETMTLNDLYPFLTLPKLHVKTLQWLLTRYQLQPTAEWRDHLCQIGVPTNIVETL